MSIPKIMVIFSMLLCLVSARASAKSQRKAPSSSFELTGLAGGKLAKDDLKDVNVVIQFWASWCAGCGPSMVRLEHVFGESKSVLFFTVSVDETISDARSYFDELPSFMGPVKAKSYFDKEARLAEAFGIKSIPTTVFMDKNSRIFRVIRGHPSRKQIGTIRKVFRNN